MTPGLVGQWPIQAILSNCSLTGPRKHGITVAISFLTHDEHQIRHFISRRTGSERIKQLEKAEMGSRRRTDKQKRFRITRRKQNDVETIQVWQQWITRLTEF